MLHCVSYLSVIVLRHLYDFLFLFALFCYIGHTAACSVCIPNLLFQPITHFTLCPVCLVHHCILHQLSHRTAICTGRIAFCRESSLCQHRHLYTKESFVCPSLRQKPWMSKTLDLSACNVAYIYEHGYLTRMMG